MYVKQQEKSGRKSGHIDNSCVLNKLLSTDNIFFTEITIKVTNPNYS